MGQVLLGLWTVTQRGNEALKLGVEFSFKFPAANKQRLVLCDSESASWSVTVCEWAEIWDMYKNDSDIATFSDASFSCRSLSCDLLILVHFESPDFDLFSEVATLMDSIKSWMEVV